MSLSERVEQLNREISAAIDRAFAEVRQEFSSRLRSSNDEIVRHIEGFTPDLPRSFFGHEDLAPAIEALRSQSEQEARRQALASLLEAVAALDRGRSQAEILTALLEGGCRFASRTALLLLRGEELHGWDGRGWSEARSSGEAAGGARAAEAPRRSLRELTFTPAEQAPGTVWARLAEARQGYLLSASEAAELCSRLEGPVPEEALLLPIVLRDRVVAALYADRLRDHGAQPAGGALDPAALRLLAYAAAQAIETLPFRERSATVTLADLAPAAPPQTESTQSTAPAETSQSLAETAAPAVEPGPEPETAGSAAGEAPEASAGLTTARVVEAPASAAEPAAAPASVEVEAVAEPPGRAAAVSGPAAADLGPPPGAEPSFLDDSLAFPSRQTTELPLPEMDRGAPGAPDAPGAMKRAVASAPGTRQERAGGDEEAARPRPVAVPPSPLPGAAGAAAETPADPADTVLLPRPGFREGLSAPWSARSPAQLEPAQDVEPAVEEKAGPLVPPVSPVSEIAASAASSAPAAEAPPSAPAAAAPSPTPAAPAASAEPSGGAAEAGAAIPRESGAYREPTTAGFESLRSSPLTSGTPEVRPPSGVQGPGWAFATSRLATAGGEEPSHEEARRLARLLVSEIKLYNEEQVEAGRRNRDIYERLREDIDRSRQMYEERVEPRLAKSTDYFYQELVRILAAGDSKALGI